MADSSLSYLAGASVERGINEAIRAEEQRAHAAEVRSLYEKISSLQDDLAYYKGTTEEFRQIGQDVIKRYELKNALCNAQAGEIEKANARIKQLEQELAASEAATATIASCHTQAEIELGDMLRDVLPRVLADIAEQHGISLADHVERLKAQAVAACPMTFDTSFSLKYKYALNKHIKAVQNANGGKYAHSVDDTKVKIKLYNELLASRG